MKKNKSWYSVILAILMTGFMIVLTSWIFLLVLWENKDTKAMENYLKSLEWAEWSLELGMLNSKEHNYSHDFKLIPSNNLSKVLFDSSWNEKKDVVITYDLNGITSDIIDKTLANGEFDIIPLFWYASDGVYSKVTNISMTGLNADVVWNIVGENEWISWLGNFTNTTLANYKTISGNDVSFTNKRIWNFLTTSDKNYLIIHNTSGISVTYNLKSLNTWEYLTKDISQIVASGEAGGYKQNLRVNINSSKYLNLLKYSIYSK